MDEASLKALKRRARLASRESGRSHQQELDRIARDEGHAHWGDLLQRAQASSARPRTTGGPAAAMPDDWASRLLDVATGARTTHLDEAMIRCIGRPVCSVVGHETAPTGIASAVLCLAAAWIAMRCGMHPEYDAIDAIVMPMAVIVSVLFHRIAWLNPDSAALRQARRCVRNGGGIIALVVAASLVPATTGALAYMQRSQLMAPLGIVSFWAIPLIPLLIGTHAGRRSGRRK